MGSEGYGTEMLPDSILKNLYEFQKKGVEYAVRRFGRILLGDEMGVGKTIQAIAIMQLYRKDWPLMIFCPSSIKYIWRDEIIKWLGSDILQWDIQLFKSGKDIFDNNAKIYIMSYELAATRFEEIRSKRFACTIADEAHYLKSRDTKRSQKLLPILTDSKRCILISGTPMLA